MMIRRHPHKLLEPVLFELLEAYREAVAGRLPNPQAIVCDQLQYDPSNLHIEETIENYARGLACVLALAVHKLSYLEHP